MRRRKFLKHSLLFGSALYFPRILTAQFSKRSRVVIAQNPSVIQNSSVETDRLAQLLDRAMQSYFNCDSPLEAWQKIVSPGEVIGIKVNCLSGPGSTHRELVDVVVERLQQAGIPERNIIIWDRLNKDLESCGFKINYRSPKLKCFGNDTVGFAPQLHVFGQAGSLVTRTLTNLCDGIINLALLRDHSIAGVSIALKNLFGAIHNPNKYHLNTGNPFVADVNAFPVIRKKVRFTIVDALEAQYHGGPAFMPQWRWPFAGLIVGRDRVAIDYTGWQIIEKKRKQMGLPSLKAEKRYPKYIFTAADADHQLGVANKKQIETIWI